MKYINLSDFLFVSFVYILYIIVPKLFISAYIVFLRDVK